MDKNRSELFAHFSYDDSLTYEALLEVEENLTRDVEQLLQRAGAAHLDFTPLGDALMFQCVFEAHRLYVYRNPAALPRSFLVPSIRLFPDQVALWHALGQARLEDLVLAVYVSETDFPGDGKVDGGPVDGHVTVLEERKDFRRFVVNADRPAVLVISDQFYPWWHWRVNGEETKAFPAYGVFQGLVVPAGQSTVEGSYQPACGKILNVWPSSVRCD